MSGVSRRPLKTCSCSRARPPTPHCARVVPLLSDWSCPKRYRPHLVELIALEWVVIDPTPRDRGLDRGRGSAGPVRPQEKTPFRADILDCVERHTLAVARLLRHRGLAVS